MPVRHIPQPIKADTVNVTSSRALSSSGLDYTKVYHNNTDRPKLVIVTCWHVVTNHANQCRTHAYLGTTDHPTDWIASGGDYDPPAAETPHSVLVFPVGAGEYYRVTKDDGTGNLSELNRWIEVEL